MVLYRREGGGTHLEGHEAFTTVKPFYFAAASGFRRESGEENESPAKGSRTISRWHTRGHQNPRDLDRCDRLVRCDPFHQPRPRRTAGRRRTAAGHQGVGIPAGPV